MNHVWLTCPQMINVSEVHGVAFWEMQFADNFHYLISYTLYMCSITSAEQVM